MRKLIRKLFSVEFIYIVLIAAQVAAITFLCVFIPSFMPLGLAAVAVWLVNFVTAVLLSTSGASAETRSAFFVLFCALPVVAPLIYLILTIGGKRCAKLEIAYKDGTELHYSKEGIAGSAEADYNKAVYYADGTRFFNALTEEIAKAEKYVYLEFYIVARGKIYERVLTALKKAKERGAEIKILMDGLGSAFRIGRREMKELRKLGEVKTFHRLNPLPLSRHNRRDHRKIAVIDGKIAFTGGINIGDEYANIDCDYGYWKDSAVLVDGGAAKVLEAMFLSVWLGERREEIKCTGDRRCLVYCDSPPAYRFCEDAYIAAISSAKDRVHIMTPYFCVSEKLGAALSFCAKRGVDVRIIIPHVPDKKYVQAVSRAYAKTLSDTGAMFYEFQPGFMHSKCLICDNTVYLGSYNFDYRSMHLNYECGIMFGGDMTAQVERDFTDCLALSTPLLHAKNTRITRVKRFFLKLFAPLI